MPASVNRPEPLRDRKRRRTRDAIVEAGLLLFTEHGFDQVTVAQIAETAEVSPATVFRYFGTKEALLFANHEAEQRALCEAVRAHAHLVDPRAAMAAAVFDLAAGIRPDEEQYAARVSVITSSPVLMGAALRTRAGWEAAAARELADAVGRAPALVDAVAAGAAVGALHAAVREWYVCAGKTALLELVHEALRALWPDVWPLGPDRPTGPTGRVM